MDLAPSILTDSHPVTIPPAPASHLRGHPKETLEQLEASRGRWNPHFVHRPHRALPGTWGRWDSDPTSDVVYGFEPVKAFLYTGKKANPEDSETDLTSSIAKSLVIHSPINYVLSIDYRLAPTAPWPLPLLDAISSYRYLLDEGISEKDIVIAGDSAGGHLALALIRWVRDEGAALGFSGPRGLVVMSPWVDVGFTNAWGEENMKYNADSDTLARKAELVLGKRPPIEDRLIEGPDAVHDFMIFPWQSEESAVVYEGLDAWLRDLLASEEEPTAEEIASPDWKEINHTRDVSRKAFKTGKSPRMGPARARRGVLTMFGDMGDEGMSMINIPALDLDATAGNAKQWLTPFTAQFERGEWDWEERGSTWSEIALSASSSGSTAESDCEDEKEDGKDG
ncbi:MAG: hypothetical protein TREMPRED_000499 [Tremellales sp. Tagirdzhanova-0007]|nr:MAG: hypothetical protein TREMPRED_000499 [Tremellales sp. Tagirdzhanova-0007]